MLIEIKKPVTARKLVAAERKLTARRKSRDKGFNAHGFCGAIKWKGNAVEIQRQMRDEWS